MTISDPQRFDRAIALIDAANAGDPNQEIEDGQPQPKELVYGRRMSEMLGRFAPEASEAVKLAVRAQHIRRWEIARDDYPRTPLGYKQWRTHLMKFHAQTAGALLREAGYDDELIGRVQSLLRKEALKLNPETQMLEDVVDLVFLEHYLEEFVRSHAEYDEAKLADILRKTWKKMSSRGHEAALSIIRIHPDLAPFVVKAVSGEAA
ncbi:MAG: DUF4202 domain-containing protein [Betaproteobacteria bacterium]|nr:DUF4202 domain-containing protein [Betaproteobacteria bacterium]